MSKNPARLVNPSVLNRVMSCFRCPAELPRNATLGALMRPRPFAQLPVLPRRLIVGDQRACVLQEAGVEGKLLSQLYLNRAQAG